jgi:hypothetical protein
MKHITIHKRLSNEPPAVPKHDGHTAYRAMAIVTAAALRARARGTRPPPFGWNLANAIPIAAEFDGYRDPPRAELADFSPADDELKGAKP